MNMTSWQKTWLIGLIGITVLLFTPAATYGAGRTITFTPKESSEVVINPGKGWLIYGPFSKLKNLPAGALAAAASCYQRYEWAQIEPTDDGYKWSVIDNDMAACVAKGLKFAFGIRAATPCTTNTAVTPEWVFTAGANYTIYQNDCEDGKITLKAPVWNDPVFKSKILDLVNDMKARYDGNPNISFVDNRNCGKYGEWHSLGCDNMNNTDKAALVDIFSGWNSPVIIPTNSNSAQYQVKYGVDNYDQGCRRDSSDYHQDGCAYAYDKGVAVSEWETSYAGLKACTGWSGQCWSKNLVPGYMSKSRYSYDNMGQWGSDTTLFYNENKALVNDWANKMGYWFRLTEATYSDNLGNGTTGTITFKMRNDGVAPIYVNRQKGGQTYVKLALLDNNNNVLKTTTLSTIDPFDWKPFDKTGLVYPETASFSFPATSKGAHLAIGLFTDSTLSKPDIKLGISGRLSSGWYALYEPVPGGSKVYLPLIIR
jgi:hypothetical protein